MTRNLKLFGQFELSGPDGKIVAASAKLSALLAYLAMAGKPVGRDQLTSLLWGSHFEEQARQNFRQALARLRKVLGSEALPSDEQSVALSQDAISSDVVEFESLSTSTDAGTLRRAVSLLRGDLLAGIELRESAFEEWLSTERRRLAILACEVLERLGRIELVEGRATEALKLAEDSIRRDIFREESHQLALRAFAALGRRSEAVRHYQHFAERLKQELGTEPDIATTEAYNQARQSRSSSDEAISSSQLRKPSIAVLPFANLSNDAEQDYFIDGIADEIITGLSRMHWLFVISRNSSFTYKGRAIDVKQVGRELGVRYVLEGSVRKAGSRLRISGQLIDAMTGLALWSDRIEGDLADVFELQDMVTSQVIGAIAPRLEQAEFERSKLKPTASLDAYDYYLRGQAEVKKYTRDSNASALAYFYKAAELDPEYATAYGMAARCYSMRKIEGWFRNPKFEIAEVRRLAQLVVELDPLDPIALSGAGMALAYVAGDLDAGDVLLDKSLQLNPNLANAWTFSGWVKAWSGEPELAISRISRAMHLSPHDPSQPNMRRCIAFSHFVAGRYEEAISTSDLVTPVAQNAIFALSTVAVCAAHLGRTEDAERAIAKIRTVDPDLNLKTIRDRFPMKREADFNRWAEGFRKAGLPD